MKVYGPYKRKDGRKHMIIIEGNKRTTVSYPKYLMELHLGRKLNDNETVDHVNRDYTDDRIENYQILIRKNHSSLDVTRVKKIKVICVWCGAEVEKNGKDLRHNEKQGKAGPFCNRSCAGKYGKQIQLGNIDKLDRIKAPQAEYFKLDKNTLGT